MSAWDELGQEQYTVMMTAVDEACLIDVMDEWRARQRWAETSDLDEVAKRNLIPRFNAVVLDLIDRGWVEFREPVDAVDPLEGAELREMLSDSASWIRSGDYDHRMVWLRTTDLWDSLVRQS